MTACRASVCLQQETDLQDHGKRGLNLLTTNISQSLTKERRISKYCNHVKEISFDLCVIARTIVSVLITVPNTNRLIRNYSCLFNLELVVSNAATRVPVNK